MIKIQQGDVLFKKVNGEEFRKLRKTEEKKQYTNWQPTSGLNSHIVRLGENKELHNSKCTVALGEATGHHHRFETASDGAMVTAYRSSYHFGRNNPQVCDYVAIEGKDGYATLTHEEHNPVTVPSGYYKIEIVKEFDHFSQLERRVVD